MLATPRTAPTTAHERGREGEQFVAEQLVLDDWVVLARNHRAAGGELDLVVERAGVLRFVEVKARAPDDDSGIESIGYDKQRRLRTAAEAWLSSRGLPEREVAFLVAIVCFDPAGWTVEWWDDAF